MSRYAYVENEQIVEVVNNLPASWKNYSNFNLMDSQSLLDIGWYPVEEPSRSPIYYNSMFQRLEMEYVLGFNKVIASYKVVRWEHMTDDDVKREYMSAIRDRRNSKLSSCDWTILPDTTQAKGQTWASQWSSYRQQLRDFPSSFESLSVNDLPEIDDVVWPQAPDF